MSEKEQAGSKVESMRLLDASEERFWKRMVKRCAPKFGWAGAIQAADEAVLALRERSVASGIHPATGSAFEQLMGEYRALEKQRDGLAQEAADVARLVAGTEEYRGKLKPTVLAMKMRLAEARAELGTLRAEVDRLRQAVRGNPHAGLPSKKVD